MGNCHPLKTNINIGFASVDIAFQGVKIFHVNLLCSQYLYNIKVSSKIVDSDWLRDI